MAIRRTLETAVAQDADGVWRQREIMTVARYRMRVVSDRSRARSHQHGTGEDFELVVDSQLEIWVRRFGADSAFRRDEDVAGVSLIVADNVTGGICHELTYPGRPASRLVRWSCSCGAGGRGDLEPEIAQKQAEDHQRAVAERDRAASVRAERRVAERQASAGGPGDGEGSGGR